MSKGEAGVLLDSMYSRVEIGRLVLLEDFSVRSITDEEVNELQAIADNHSARK